MKLLYLFALCVFSCVAVRADELSKPVTPKPKPAVEKHFAKRIWLAETATYGGLYAADLTLTARGLGTCYDTPNALGQCHRWRETDTFFFGQHPSNARLVGVGAAVFFATTAFSYKAEASRHRWLRVLGHALMADEIVGESINVHSWTH